MHYRFSDSRVVGTTMLVDLRDRYRSARYWREIG